jgi:uncharacterized protein GlcG (DUF336 family)
VAGRIEATARLTLEGARGVLDAALSHASSMGVAVCVAVTDPAGEPIVVGRMDGAPTMSLGIAVNKAYTVCGFNGMPTGAWWRGIEGDPSLVHGITHTPRLVVFAGGVGVFHEGGLIGAIGVSGGSPAQDVEVANAGAAVFAAAD